MGQALERSYCYLYRVDGEFVMSLSHTDFDDAKNEVFHERSRRMQPWVWAVVLGAIGIVTFLLLKG